MFTFPISTSQFEQDLWLNVKAEGVLSSYVVRRKQHTPRHA